MTESFSLEALNAGRWCICKLVFPKYLTIINEPTYKVYRYLLYNC